MSLGAVVDHVQEVSLIHLLGNYTRLPEPLQVSDDFSR